MFGRAPNATSRREYSDANSRTNSNTNIGVTNAGTNSTTRSNAKHDRHKRRIYMVTTGFRTRFRRTSKTSFGNGGVTDMPSTNQQGNDSGDYRSEAHKMLAEKNDLTIAALIRGIDDADRAQAFIDAEVELADDEDRDVRTDVIGACNRKKAALTQGEDAEDDTEG